MIVLNISSLFHVKGLSDEFIRLRSNEPQIFYSMTITEMMSISISISICLYLFYLTYRIPILHKNLLFLIRAFAILRCFFLSGRMVCLVLAYMDELRQSLLLLIGICSALRNISSFSEIFLLTTLAVERIIATMRVRYYENSESTVGVYLIIANLLISTGFALIVFAGIPLYTVFPGIVNVIALVMIYEYVRRVNTRVKKEMKKFNSSFTLSTRYQIEENFKVIKAGKYLVVVIISQVIVCTAINLLLFQTTNLSPEAVTTVMETVVSCYSIPMFLTLICCFDEYRFFTYRLFRIKVSQQTFNTGVNGDEARLYMEQLAQSWNITVPTRTTAASAQPG